jgi:hypothetical protein
MFDRDFVYAKAHEPELRQPRQFHYIPNQDKDRKLLKEAIQF